MCPYAPCANDNPVHQVLYDCTKLWWQKVQGGAKGGPVLYDVAPVFWIADPSTVQTKKVSVRVELDGQYTRGQTVRVPKGRENVLESVSLDAAALRSQFTALLAEAAPGQR